jgi:4-carboxymuconolactone decarboxylase
MLREAGFEGDIFTPDEMLRHSVCIDALKKLPVRKYHSNGGPGEVSGAAGVFLPWAEEVRKYPVFKDVWHKRRPAGSGNCLPLPRPLSWSQVDQEHIGQQGGKQMSEKIVQTAGRKALGNVAPEFAHFNDDVLFGENWNNEDLDLKTRCLITVVALMAQGITDSSLKYHIQNAKQHGVSQKEMAAAITHVAFYAGWPKAWAVFSLAKEVYGADE